MTISDDNSDKNSCEGHEAQPLDDYLDDYLGDYKIGHVAKNLVENWAMATRNASPDVREREMYARLIVALDEAFAAGKCGRRLLKRWEDEGWLSVRAAAAKAGVSRPTIYKAIKAGYLPSTLRSGSTMRISKAELNRAVDLGHITGQSGRRAEAPQPASTATARQAADLRPFSK